MSLKTKRLLSLLGVFSIGLWCGSIQAHGTKYDQLISTATYESAEIISYGLPTQISHKLDSR